MMFLVVVIRSSGYQGFLKFFPTDQYETVEISLVQLLRFLIQHFLQLSH